MPHRKLQRNTPQRRIILEELRKADSHPTAVELYDIVRRQMPGLSLATVYRNLDLLAEQGTIRKLTLGGKETRFDGKLDRHYHVRCVRCGRVDDLRELPAESLPGQPRHAAGYQILDHSLEFVGVCPDCRGTVEPSAGGRKRQNA